MKIFSFINKIKEQYKNMSKPTKASFWYVICNIINKGIVFLTTPLFTRILTTDEYGIFSLYNSWLTIISIFATLELATGVYNKAMIKYQNDRDGYTSTILVLASVATFMLFCTYVIFKDFWNQIFTLDTSLIVLIFLQIAFSTPVALWSIRKRFEYEYKGVISVTLISNFAGTLLSLFFVLKFPQYHIYGRILGILGVNIFINIFIAGIILKKGRKIIHLSYWRYAINYNLPLIPHYLAQQVLDQADRIMINNMCGSSDVAIYSIAYQVASGMKILTNAVHASFMPWTFQKMNDHNEIYIGNKAFYLEIAIGILCLLFSLFAPELVWILGGSEYYLAVYIIPPVSMSVIFITMYSFFGNIEFYFEKTKFTMIASVVVAICNIFLNYFFINLYGFIAAGYTTLFCYIVYAALHYKFMKYICKCEKTVNPYNGLLMWSSAITITISTIVISFLYKYFVARYIVIIVLIIGIWLFYRKWFIFNKD